MAHQASIHGHSLRTIHVAPRTHTPTWCARAQRSALVVRQTIRYAQRQHFSISALSATASAQRQYPSDVDTYLARERHAKCYVTAQDSAEAPATADHVSMDTYRELVNVVDC
jgi:hypothetical protein